MVRLEQVAYVLGRAKGIVGVGRILSILAGEQRIVRETLHVDADRGIADVGIPHRRTRLLVSLTETDPQFIGTTRGAAGHLGRVGEICLVDQLRRGRVVSRLAADTDVILRLRA